MRFAHGEVHKILLNRKIMGRDKFNKKVKFAGLIALAATFLMGAGAFAINFLGGNSAETVVAEAATASEIATSWTNFIKGTGTSWTLPDNWTATQNTSTYISSFGSDTTAFKDGALYIPEGRTVTINLNGKTLNRNQIIEADNGCVIYNEGNLTISGTGTITGGNNKLDGGGIYNAGTLTISGGTITGNKTAKGGGGIYGGNNSTTNISSGTISLNVTDESGGGINTIHNSTLNITGGTFTENEAKHYGGGVYLNSKSTAISNATFTKNNCGGDGGGICFSLNNTAAVTISGVTVTNNTAVGWGGGIRIDNTNVTITGNSKINNNQGAYGGGIALGASNTTYALTINNTTISSNVVYAVNNGGASGGGIYCSQGTLNLNSGATVSGNHSHADMTNNVFGGGLYSTRANVNLDGATIDGNYTTSHGGGMYVDYGNFNMTGNTTVSNNWNSGNDGWGGGLFLTNNSKMTITGGTFLKNGFQNGTKTVITTHGAGIFLNNGCLASTITKCTFQSNASRAFGTVLAGAPLTVGVAGNNTDVKFIDNYATYGAAVEVHSAEVTINGATFEGNCSNRGAIYDNYSSQLTINGGIYKNNGFPISGAYACTGDGGNGAVVYVENEPTGCATLNITGGTFTGNKSTTGTGGVVYCGGKLNISGGTFTGNQAKLGSVVYMTKGNGHAVGTISGGTFGGSTANANTGSGDGGCITTETGTTLTLSGGNISYNKNSSTAEGAGARIFGTLNISGAPVIANNTSSRGNSNLYSNQVINITGALTTSLNIYTSNKGVLTSGYNSVGKQTSATLFKTDLSGYKVAYQSQEIVIVTSATDATKVLVTPVANSAVLSYSGSRQTIVSGYITGDMTIVSVTLTRFGATSQSTLGTTNTTLSNTSNSLGYSISGTTITATEAGKYTVVFRAAGSKTSWVKADGTTVTGDQTVTVTINKKTLDYAGVSRSITYDGNNHISSLNEGAPSVASGTQFYNIISGWTLTYYKGSISEANKVANATSDATYAKYASIYYATYTPVFKSDMGYNYYVPTRSSFVNIAKRQSSNLTVTVDSTANLVYDGTAKKPSFTISYGGVTMYTYNGATGAITANNTSAHGTLTFTVAYSDNTRPGNAKITITVSSGTNFANNNEKIFVIQPMSMSGGSITGAPSFPGGHTKVYDGTTSLEVTKGTLSTTVSGVSVSGVVANFDNANVGTGKTITLQLILTGADADLWDAKLTYTDGAITQKTLSSSTASVAAVAAVTYNGSAHKPEPVVTDTARKVALVKDTDYTISYSANLNKGTATITFTGKGNYTGATLTKTFTINAKNIATNGTVAAVTDVTFKGAAYTPTPAVTNTAKNAGQTSETLTKDTDYTLSYSNSNGGAGNSTNAGTVTVTVTGKGNYTGSMTTTFKINPKDIAGATVALTGNTGLVYSASAQAAGANVSIVLIDGNAATALASGTDFTLSYSNSNGGAGNTTNAGTVTVTVTGKGNYTGTATAKPTYVIEKAEISRVDFDKTSFIYNNQVQRPATTDYATATTVNGTKVGHSAMLSVSAGQIDASSTAYSVDVTINAAYTGNYKFASTVTNATTRASDTKITKEYSIAKVKITGVTWTASELTYSGSAQAPTVSTFETEAVVNNRPNASALFTISGQQTDVRDDCTAVATIKSEYAGNYEFGSSLQYNGNASQTSKAYKIKPASILKIDAEKELATAYNGTFDGENHDSVIKNAQMEVPASNTMKWYYKTTAAGTVWSEMMPYYKNAGTYDVWYKITADNHADVEGSVTVKIEQWDLKDAIIGAINDVTFNGSAFTPTPSVSAQLVSAPAAAEALTAGTHFTYSYSDNTDKGTATVTVTAVAGSNYKGSTSKTFTINAKDIAASTVSVADIPAETYNGLAHTPTPVVSDSESGATLVKDTDYTFTYSANTAAGTATITFTGIGNYTGTTTKTFTINEKGLAGARINGGNALADEIYTGSAITPSSYTLEVDLTGSGTYTTLNIGTDYTLSYENNTNQGTATIKFTGTGNYNGDISATFVIKNAAITPHVTESELSWTYDGKTHRIGLGGAVAARAARALADQIVNISIGYTVKGGNTVTLQLAKGDTEPADWSTVTANTLDFKNVADNGKVWYRLTADNHDAYVGSFEIAIEQKEITAVTGVAFNDKVYDGTTAATLDKVNAGTHVFTGILEGDTLTVDSADNIDFDTKNVGTGKAVTATGVTLGGASAGNYKIAAATTATGTASVSKLKIEIEWHVDNFEGAEGLSIVYDGKPHKAVARIKNVKGSDLDGLVVKFNDSKVSGETATLRDSYRVVVTEILNDSGNYTLEGVALESMLEIVGSGDTIYRDLTVESGYVYDGKEKKPALYYNKTVDGVQTKVYISDDEDAFVTYSVDGVNGGKAIDAGDHNVVLQLNPKYDWSGDLNGVFTLHIGKATLDINEIKADGATLEGAGVYTYTYNNAQYALTEDWANAKINGKLLSEVFGTQTCPDGVSVSYFYDNAVANGKTAANESGYAVEIRFTVNGNFEDIDPIKATMKIMRKEINLDGVTFEGVGTGWTNLAVNYDGTLKTVEAKNVPADISSVNFEYFKDGTSVGTGGVREVGAYSAVATLTYDSANYKLVKGGAEVSNLSCGITVNPKTIDLSGVTYDGTTDENGVTYDGEVHKVAAGNIPEGVTGVSYEYFNGSTSLGADGVKNAGDYKAVVTFTLSDNYGGGTTSVEKQIKINKAVLTVKVNGSVISYGDDAKNDGVTVSGLLGNDTAAVLSLTYTYTKDGNAYRRGDDVGEYVISVTGAEPENYTLSVETAVMTVKPREITVAWRNGASDTNTSFEYVYSAGTVWTPYAYVTNAYGTDALTLTVDGGREDAAMNCTATVVGINGDKAHNYKLPTVEAKRTFNVLPAPRTGIIVWEDAEFVYNGQAQAPKAYYFENETDRVPKELSVSVNRTAVNVGHYTATASLGSNYDLQGSTTKEFDILVRKVYIEILDASVRYSANIDYSVLDYAIVEGSLDFVSADSCKVNLSAVGVDGIGKFKIAGAFSTNNAGNYEVTFVGNHVDGDGGVLTVTRGAYDMTGLTFAGAEATYDGQPHNLTVSGLPEGVTATITYSKGGVSYAANKVINAGKYSVEIKFGGDFVNYEALETLTVTLEIKKAALTVKANNSEIVYGDEPKANGVTYSGFVNGENENMAGIISGTLLYTYTYSRYGNTGTYSVKPADGCLNAENYDVVYAAGALTVKPRELTVEWYADGEKTSTTLKYVYDNLSHAPVAVIAGGVVNGDVVTVTVNGAQTEIGENYTATAVTDNANYVVAESCKTAKFGIIPAEKYTLVWDHTELVYNGKSQAPKAYYYDADGERQEITSGISGAGVNAGNYTASVTNYNADGHVLSGSYDYEIVAASVTVEITGGKTVKYGEKATFTSSDWSVTAGEIFNSDDLKITLKTVADEKSNIGAYAITATFDNGNYKVTFVNGILTVEKADIDESGIAFDVQNGSYGYDGTQRSAKIVSLPEGVTGVRYEYKDAAGNVVSTEGVKNAGVYTVTAKFTVNGNYNEVAGTYTATITITAKELSGITLTGGTVTYDGTAHVPVLSGDFTAVTDVVYTYEKGGSKVESAVNAGEYKVTVVLTIDRNYDASKIAGAVYDAAKNTLTFTTTLTVEKAELKVTANDGVTEYGKGAANDGYGYTLRGFVNGENESAITVKSVTYAYATGKNANTTPAGKYTGEITVTLVIEAENYKMAGAGEAGTLTVTPKTITVEWQAGEGGEVVEGKFVHVYDGKDYAPVAVAKDENGVIAGVTLTVSGKQSALGDNYTAKVTGLEGGNGNYALPLEESIAQFRIVSEEEEVREGKVIWDNTEHEYDGKPYKPTAYFYVGETKHEIPDSLITVAEGVAVNVNTYTARVPAVIDGVTLEAESTEMSFEIKKRTVYIVIGDLTAYYGTAVNLGAVSYGYKQGSAAFLDNDYKIEITCEATVTSPIGKYKLAGRFISNDAANYNVVFSGSWASPDSENGRFGTLTVERAVYDISKVTFMDTEVTYDGLLHKVTVNGLPAGLTEANYDCSYTGTQGFGGGAEGVKSAGTYTVTIKFKNLDPNYEPIADMHTTLELKKAALTVKANDSEVVYGDEPLTAGVDWANAGFVTGETESVLGGELKYSYTYTRGASVGDYVIKVSGLTAVNYEITYLAGTMKVIPRTVTVSWYYDETLGTQELSYRYDGNAHKPVAVAGNLVAGDVATIEVTGEKVDIGKDFTATAASVSNSNYKLPEDGSEKASFSVMPVDDKYIIWNYSELTYNGTLQMPHVYYLDENGKEVSLDEFRTVTRNNGIAAGEHTVEIPTTKYLELGLRGNATYNYKIEKAKLTVKINNSSMKFKEPVVLNGYVVEGTVYGGDNLGIVLDTSATSASSVGEYEITATYTNGNYDITFVNGTLTVEKADVDEGGITFDNVNAVYGYDDAVKTAGVKTPLPEGVTGVRYEYRDASGNLVSADGVKDVGVYTVYAIFTVDGNHNEVKGTHSTTITINKAAINVDDVRFDEVKSLGYSGEVQKVFVSGMAEGVSAVTYTYYEYDENAADGLGTVLGHDGVTKAGKYVVIAEFTAKDNYTADGVKLTMLLTVEKAALTVTVESKTLVYGTAANANGYGYIVTGLLGGDKGNEGAVLGGLTLTYAQASHTDAGTYGIIASWQGTEATSFETENYKVTVTNGTLTVTKYVITAGEVEWTNAAGDSSKTFIYEEDGGEHAPYASVNISGITLTVSGGASAAGKYTATVTGVDNANYEVEANITRTFEIVATMPEIVWADTQFVYDGQPHVPTATLADGTAVSETVTVVGGSAVNKGTYTAEIVYNGTTYTTTFEITARKVYIVIDEVTTTYKVAPDFTGAARYLYTDADKQFAGENIEDMLTFRSSVPVTAPVGTYAGMITARYTGSDNYEVTLTNGTLRILKAQYDMSNVRFRSYAVDYDGLPHAAEVVGYPEGVTPHISYYTSTSGWSYDQNGVITAGVYSVKVTFSSDDGNYEPIPDRTGTMEIRKKVISVKANDSTIVYGDEPVANGVDWTVAEFVNGEDESVLEGTLGFSFNYNKNGAAGTYAITPEGLTSENYDVKFVSGVLTVEKRVITVSWYKDSLLTGAALQYNYDGVTEFKPYAVAGNVVAGDSVTLTVSGGQRAAGLQYVATVSRISNNNYVLPDDGSASVSFDVLPRAYEIVWENTEFVYDPLKKQAPGAYYFDENGEKVALTVTILGNRYNVDADTYTAMVAGAPNGVSLSELKGDLAKEFVIQKKKITIKINSVVATYGKLPAFDQDNWTYVGENRITDGNFITLYCDVTKLTNPDAGVYAITGGCSSGNYDVEFIPGSTYTIVRAEISAPVIASKDYTGGLLTADVPANAMYDVLRNYGGINAGSYVVRLYLKSEYTKNYKWADTEEYYIDIEFLINKSVNDWDVPFEMDWVLDADAATLNANVPESKFGTPEVKFYTDASYAAGTEISESEILANKAQGRTYYVRVTVDETDNYTGLKFEKSIVIVGDRSLALNWEAFDATYDGTEHKPKAYVTIDGEKVYLVVTVNSADGKAVHAGDYTATVTFKAEDGRNLSAYKLYEGAPSADKTIAFKIAQRKVTVQIGDIDSVDYGTLDYDTTTIIVDLKVGTISTIVEGSAVSGNIGELDLHFRGTFQNAGGFVNAGSYAIIGECNNGDYDVTFAGSWTGEGENNGKAGTYTVNRVDLAVNKTGSDWFDEEGVIDRNQSAFISLGEKDETSGEYKNIALKGNKLGGLEITYSGRAYEYTGNVLTDEEIADRIAKNQTTPPEIMQAGDFVVYYRIKGDSDNDNYNTKYGQWIIRIRVRSEFIIVNFTKGLNVNYGDVTDRDLLPELIAQGCIEIGDGFEITLDELKTIAKAYAYEDVSDENGFVGGATTVGNYTIKLVFNERIDSKYDHLEFKYSDSNGKPDSNTNQFKVTARELTLEWGESKFAYDGASHIPTATLKGLIGGKTVVLNDLKLGVNTVEVDGVELLIKVTLFDGANTTDAGVYMLQAEIASNENYVVKTGAVVAVSIVDESKVTLPTWAIIAIVAAAAVAVMITVILIVVLKKRKKAQLAAEGMIDEEGFNEDYQG